MPWHEKLLLAALAVAAVVWLARWLLDQIAKGS